jgi:dihydropteroate synthase
MAEPAAHFYDLIRSPSAMPPPLTLRGATFEWGSRTYLMGILNLTPDSFSGDGLMTSGEFIEKALDQARQFIAGGADILDVGGESTRPGADPVGLEEELQRVIPFIEALRRDFDNVISIDTYKSEVARPALAAGADIVNDVWGLRADPEMAYVVASAQAPVILMHNRSNPTSSELRQRLGGRYVGVKYDDLIEDIKRELLECVELAHTAGIPDKRIILDPGIGFGKTTDQNLALVNHLDQFRSLGYPLLIGPSRKSFIGYTLDLPPDQRLEGTAAAVAIGIYRGAHIVRVHDVGAMARVARMADAIRSS